MLTRYELKTDIEKEALEGLKKSLELVPHNIVAVMYPDYFVTIKRKNYETLYIIYS